MGSPNTFKSLDGGQTWTEIFGGASAIAIDPVSPANLYLAAFAGVFKSIDGGSTWLPRNDGLPTLNSITVVDVVIDPQHPTTIFCAAASGATGGLVAQVFKSVDGASTWTPSGLSLDPSVTVNVLAIDPVDSSHVYAGTDVGVFATADGGANWFSFSFGLPQTPVKHLEFETFDKRLHAGTSSWGVFDFDLATERVPVAQPPRKTREVSFR